ncbi:MAG: YqgE/AlgH family protein [Nocardioidaceae bacterium]|nr:YqgE/AlgH family protein [Nocardioidaceae bacterium]MBA3800611.1 YqgE/AlgH family protein [Geodermatophilaceae bacterium]
MEPRGPDLPRWWTGLLLVASPALREGSFARSVVLLLDHDGDGALGVVLNRPSELAVNAVLAGWVDVVSTPPLLFTGGPVSTGSALGVARLRPGTPAAPLGWRRVFDDTGLLDLDTPAEVLVGALEAFRIFAGHSGWAPGQLEAEVEEGSWYVLPAAPGDLVTRDPQRLWAEVFRRQGGRLALLSTLPADPTEN